MAIVSVNGVPLPVAVDSATLSLESVGSEVARNASGFAVRDRRAVKHVLEFEVVPKSLDEAMLYRLLITGEGEFWSMLSSAYGAKGLAVTGTGARDSSTANTNPSPVQTTGAWATTVGQTMVLEMPHSSQASVAAFVENPGENGGSLFGTVLSGGVWRTFGWSWRANDTTPTVKRERVGALGSSGPAQTYTKTDSITVGATAVTVTGADATSYWSNMLWLPRYFPSTQVDAVLAGYNLYGYAAPDLPRVLVHTDLFPSGLVASTAVRRGFVALGDVARMVLTPHHRSGAFDPTALAFGATLTEV